MKESLSSFCWALLLIISEHESFPFWSPNPVYLRLLFISFTYFPFLSISAWESIPDLDRFFQFQGLFVPQGQEGTFLGVLSHIEGKVHHWNFLRSHLGNKKV